MRNKNKYLPIITLIAIVFLLVLGNIFLEIFPGKTWPIIFQVSTIGFGGAIMFWIAAGIKQKNSVYGNISLAIAFLLKIAALLYVWYASGREVWLLGIIPEAIFQERTFMLLVLGHLAIIGVDFYIYFYADPTDRFKNELSGVNEKLTGANEELTAANEKLTIANGQITSLKTELGKANKSLTQANESLTETNLKLTDTEKKLTLSEATLTEYQEKLTDAERKLSQANEDLTEASSKLRDFEEKLTDAENKLTAIEPYNAAIDKFLKNPFVMGTKYRAIDPKALVLHTFNGSDTLQFADGTKVHKPKK
jgi:uncharacterized coiled-coil protein SlyX